MDIQRVCTKQRSLIKKDEIPYGNVKHGSYSVL